MYQISKIFQGYLIRVFASFVNLAGNPQAIEGQDYEFYCPINLDNEGKVNKNSPDYFVAMKKCQLPIEDPENGGNSCRTTQTLEQQFSGSISGKKMFTWSSKTF